MARHWPLRIGEFPDAFMRRSIETLTGAFGSWYPDPPVGSV